MCICVCVSACGPASATKGQRLLPGWGRGWDTGAVYAFGSSVCSIKGERVGASPREQGSLWDMHFILLGLWFWLWSLIVNWSLSPLNSPAIHSSQDEWLICFSEHLRKGHHMLLFSLCITAFQVFIVKGHFFLNLEFYHDTLSYHSIWFPIYLLCWRQRTPGYHSFYSSSLSFESH